MIRQNFLNVTLLLGLVGGGLYSLRQMPPTPDHDRHAFMAEPFYAPAWVVPMEFQADEPGIKQAAKSVSRPYPQPIKADTPVHQNSLFLRPTYPPKPVS